MPAPEKKPKDLTAESFHRLLDFLESDRQRAAERYQTIRDKLTRFFEWKGCIPGVDFADETIDRVARRLESGIESPPEDPYHYFHGVAVNVVRERWRKAKTDPQPLDTLPLRERPAVDPLADEHRRSLESTAERRLGCLHDCLDRLTPASRNLLLVYHLGGPGSQIGRRKGMAVRLNIPAAALRLRVYRVRRQMERCVARCLERGAE